MANRYFRSQYRRSFLGFPVDLYGSVAIGASGAPTIDAAKSQGIASIVRNSAGNYTVTLSDAYARLLGVYQTLVLAAGDPAARSMVVRSSDVVTAKTIVIEFLDETGAAVDPASGVTLLLHIDLNNSSV